MVDRQPVHPIFQFIIDADHSTRQLLRFAHRHEAKAKLMGDAGPEYEASRLYSCDQRRLIRRGRRRHPTDRGAQAPATVAQRGDVAEMDTRLRKITTEERRWGKK